MDEVTLIAERGREAGKGVARRLRANGKVPAIVYGLGSDPVSVAVSSRELGHILHGPGGVNTLIDLNIEGGMAELVLARQVQRDPVKHSLVHVDFVRVRRDALVSADVPIHLIGDPPGVKDGGVLDQEMFSLHIEAKPGDIPNAIDVDVSKLEIGGHVRAAEIVLPRGVTTAVDPEDLVAQVMVPRGLTAEEEEVEAAEGEEAAAGEAPEGEGGGGEAGQESAE
jgi:large subunit ribosomal protein L25